MHRLLEFSSIFLNGRRTNLKPGGVRWGRVATALCLDAAAAEELCEGRVDVLLVVDADADEALFLAEPVVEDGEQRARRTAVTAAALLADLAVAEEIARLNEFVGEADSLLV